MRLLLAAAVVLAAVLVPTSAHASEPFLLEVASVPNTDVFKTATATCSQGKVFGIGGRIKGGNGSVILTGVSVNDDLSSVTAFGHARPGFTGAWSVIATAVCREPEQLDPERVLIGGIAATAAAPCPDNKILYSSGYLIPRMDGTQYVDEVVPSPGLTEVTVHAGSTSTSPATVMAVAVCALPMPFIFHSHARVRAATAHDSTITKEATALKSSVHMLYDEGSWIFGAGADINGPAHAFIEAFTPTSSLDGARVKATYLKPALTFAATPGVDSEWDMTVYGSLIGSWY